MCVYKWRRFFIKLLNFYDQFESDLIRRCLKQWYRISLRSMWQFFAIKKDLQFFFWNVNFFNIQWHNCNWKIAHVRRRNFYEDVMNDRNDHQHVLFWDFFYTFFSHVNACRHETDNSKKRHPVDRMTSEVLFSLPYCSIIS